MMVLAVHDSARIGDNLSNASTRPIALLSRNDSTVIWIVTQAPCSKIGRKSRAFCRNSAGFMGAPGYQAPDFLRMPFSVPSALMLAMAVLRRARVSASPLRTTRHTSPTLAGV